MRMISMAQIADDLSVSVRHVARLNIPGKNYALGRRSPRWFEDDYKAWKAKPRKTRRKQRVVS